MTAQLSLPYSDLPALVGQEIGVSEWLTITQERIDQFADATGDDYWIHVDPERAKTVFGSTIAHGYLVLSLIPFLAKKIARPSGIAYGLNYGVNTVRFTKPVPVGAHIRVRLGVKSVEERSGGRQVVYNNVVEMEGTEKPVCIAETIALYFPGDAA